MTLGIETPQDGSKLTFVRINSKGETKGDLVSVDYNPKELAFSKKVNFADIAIPGLDAPIIQFVRGDAETTSVSLLFDTSKKGMGAGAESVADRMKALYSLVKIDGDLHSPSLVRMTWGDQNIGTLRNGEQDTAPSNVFDAVVLNVDRKFVLFTASGIPVRGTLTMALREYCTVSDQIDAINLRSADHTRIYTVLAGDNLPGIANKKYGNPSFWRMIAQHNNIRHVRYLQPGLELELPPVVY